MSTNRSELARGAYATIPIYTPDETEYAIDLSDNNTVYASSFYGNLDRAELDKRGPATGWRAMPFLMTNIMPKVGEGEPPLPPEDEPEECPLPEL